MSRLLIVDDDPNTLASLSRAFRLSGYEAVVCDNAARAETLVRTARQDTGIRIEISDTGQGLTEEECARLFTPYYTTKQHGTGLGLAIVQSVVSDHQGKISLVSRAGQGATFVIDLPGART